MSQKIDLISRADAIDAVEKLKIAEDNKNYPDYAYNTGIETAKKVIEVMLSADAEEYIKGYNTNTHDLVHRNAVKPKTVDCTEFLEWLKAEVLDEKNWELNAVANGEIICRKFRKLGWLDVEDGYYVDTRPTGEWIKSNILPNGWHCSHCDSPVMTDDIKEMLFCPNCGSYNGGEEE